MTSDAVITALAMPDGSRVDQRVPKKMLLEQGAPTAADKRAIQDGIEELVWVAALKATNVGVPAFRDEVREYLEVAVLTATFRACAKASRLVELIHRAIPYPVVLVSRGGVENTETVSFSVAHKRWSQGEAGKVVVENVQCTAPFRSDAPMSVEAMFLGSLAVAGLPRGDLFAMYQGIHDRVAALAAARITGVFVVPGVAEHGAALKDGIEEYGRIERELVGLRAQAKKEKQMNRRVELNLAIKRLEGELGTLRAKL